MVQILVFSILFVIAGCKSDVDVQFVDNLNSQLGISLDELSLSSNDFSQDVYVSVPFTGDDDNDAVITLFYCSLKKQAGCDPLTGQSVTLTKSGKQFIGSVNISLSSELSSGDMMKYQLVSMDSSGTSDGDDYGYILIPYDGSVPRAIRQLGKFSFGSGKPQLNAGGYEYIFTSVISDEGEIFLAGASKSHLGEYVAGGFDAIIVKLKPSGELDEKFANGGVWQLGLSSSDASGSDHIKSIALDSSGNLFAGGYTFSSLSGANAGESDAFILKMNANTGELDSRFGDGDGEDGDGIVQINASNIALGSLADSNEYLETIILDGSGNLFAGGYSYSSLSGVNAGDADGFILKMNTTSGVLDSTFGNGDGENGDGIVLINASNIAAGSSASGDEYIYSIALDGSGNLYAGGSTYGSLSGANAGYYDGFLLKMNATSGVLDSTFGDGDGENGDGIVQINASNIAAGSSASGDEYIHAIALDGSGNLFVGGNTYGSLSGANAGSYDAFILKMNATSGVLDSTFGNGDGENGDGIVQINASNIAAGSSAAGSEYIRVIALDGSGNLYAGGSTYGSLSGTNAGDTDAFIFKINTSTGVLDSSFGNDDGEDGDGIVQINASNIAASSSANVEETVYSIFLDGSGSLFAVGSTGSSLSGLNAGANDGFILKMNTTTGLLDSTFGDGDGENSDGIVQINASNIAAGSSVVSTDDIYSIALDNSGNLYAGGSTFGSLSGINAGGADGFILKMNASSGVLDSTFGDGDGKDNDGIVQINASNIAENSSANKNEYIKSIVLDGSGNLFAGGYTNSSLSGVNAGDNDGFILKMNATTGVLDNFFGNGDGEDGDGIVQINATNIATSSDASNGEIIKSIALDGSGSLFAAGLTFGGLSGISAGGEDAFILKINATTGVLDSTFGSGDGENGDGIVQINASNIAAGSSASGSENIETIVIDGSGNLFAGGYTSSSLSGSNAGSYDVFVLKMSANTGVLDSTFGTGDGENGDGIVQINSSSIAAGSSANSYEVLNSITLDGSGNLFAGGYTASNLSGANAGALDIFIIKMSTTTGILDSSFGDGDGENGDGIVQINASNIAIGSSANGTDSLESMITDGSGNLLIGGYTSSSLSGTNAGGSDAFIMKLNSSTGILDSSFGDGDGEDNDGILQVNASNIAASSSASSNEYIYSIAIDNSGNIFAGGSTYSSLSDVNGGGNDSFTLMISSGSERLD